LQVIQKSDKVAVIGDGKLGLLVAQALIVLKEVKQLTHFGRHQEKLRLVSGTNQVVVNDKTKTEHNQVSMKEICALPTACTTIGLRVQASAHLWPCGLTISNSGAMPSQAVLDFVSHWLHAVLLCIEPTTYLWHFDYKQCKTMTNSHSLSFVVNSISQIKQSHLCTSKLRKSVCTFIARVTSYIDFGLRILNNTVYYRPKRQCAHEYAPYEYVFTPETAVRSAMEGAVQVIQTLTARCASLRAKTSISVISKLWL